MTHRIVVLGAGYAGLAAAKRLDRRLRHTAARITLINAVDRFTERVRLHQLAAGQRLADLPLRGLLDRTGVELLVARAVGVDVRDQTVRLDAAPHTVPYDTLVYALGSATDTETVPGVAEHACTVAEPERAARLRARAARVAADGGRLTVVGGGLTGVETATELAEAHPRLRVRLVSDAPVGGWLSARAQRYLRRELDLRGIAVRDSARIAEVGAHGMLLDDGEELPADAVVWAAGFRVPPLAAEAGLAVDGHGRMVVDATLRSMSHPRVYGIGDAAAAPTPGGAESRMSCQTGLPMGSQVADRIADRLTGRDPSPLRLRYVWQNISLGRRAGITQFTRADDSPRDVVLTGRTAARFKELITRGTVSALRYPGPYLPTRHRPLCGTAPAGDPDPTR